MRRRNVALGLVALVLAACSGGDSEAVIRALLAHADPDTWEKLDDSNPPRRLRDPRTGITFVRVPEGEFRSGAVGQERTFRVTKPFLLAEHELTIGQWRRYVAELGGDAAVPVPSEQVDLPMPMSWLDAQQTCKRLGYRLPTEAEWERACRADHDPATAPWSTPALLQEHAWFNANAGTGSKPVRSRLPNALGLYDMLGNLWEWCADWQAPLPVSTEPIVDPTGPPQGTAKALRGGSWFTTPGAIPDTRTAGFPDERNAFYGVRPARSL